MKLSPAQKEIVRHMQNGSRLNYNAAWGTFTLTHIEIVPGHATVRVLLAKGIMAMDWIKSSSDTISYSLTVIGKQITL